MTDLLPGITLFTPTFNRAGTLRRLYESILRQPCQTVEWLIVDDGSTDHTRELIHRFIQENKVQIRYIHKENGGKHTALNIGIREARREYFFCVDSDDLLTEGAVSAILDCVAQRKPNGIIAYKSNYATGQQIGTDFPSELDQTTLLALINTYACGGDRSLIYRTSLLRNFSIPEPEGERFFPETYLYDRFDERYTCVLLRQTLCACEYLSEGYSHSFRKLMIDNPLSMKWFYAARLDMDIPLSVRFDAAFRYIAFSMMTHCSQGSYQGKSWPLLICAFPAGFMMFLVYTYHGITAKHR